MTKQETQLIKTSLSWIMAVLNLYLGEKEEEIRRMPMPINDKKAMDERTEAIQFFRAMAVSGEELFTQLQEDTEEQQEEDPDDEDENY